MKYSDPIIINSNQPQMSRRKKTSSKKSSFIYVLLFVFLWVGLVCAGFYFTKQYLDNAINNIQLTNAMQIEKVQERLDSLNNEMIALKSELSSTDETLSSSSSIQEQLHKKIDLLDSQLKNLEKSLKILKEAP